MKTFPLQRLFRAFQGTREQDLSCNANTGIKQIIRELRNIVKSLWGTKEKLPREHKNTYSLEDLYTYYMYSLGTLIVINIVIFSHNFGYLLARVVINNFIIHLDCV